MLVFNIVYDLGRVGPDHVDNKREGGRVRGELGSWRRNKREKEGRGRRRRRRKGKKEKVEGKKKKVDDCKNGK